MRKSLPVTIWLKRFNSLSSNHDYQIVKIVNSVTVWANPVLRLGDIVPEKLAQQLSRSYRVTIK